MTSNSTPTHRRNGRWTYPMLLAVQTLGAGIILWNGVPIYRQIVADASKHEPRPETLIWGIAAAAMVQSGYWLRQRLDPPLPHGNALLGHIVLFLGRLNFVLATSTFSVVFIEQPEGLHLPASRVPLLVVLLFSMFCYTLELERFGRALQAREVSLAQQTRTRETQARGENQIVTVTHKSENQKL